MIEKLLQREVQDFIVAHEHDDERALVLKHKTILDVPAHFIAEQISGRRKAKIKTPLYYNTRNILYPPGLNLEQSSSEKTAQLKADALKSTCDREAIADLTGGFGIDSFLLSKVFKTVHYVDPNASLLEIARHNHETMGATNIQYHNTTAEEFIKQSPNLSCIFIDPSRRDKSNQKVFKLADCEPNAPLLLPELFTHADYVLIKTSPLLDIQQGIQELTGVEKILVVAVDNECKELLYLCHHGFEGEPDVVAINIEETRQEFSFNPSIEKSATTNFSDPLSYVYEPNAAILKAGAFKLLAEWFSILKIQTSTHLYTSDHLIQDFPGRIFKVIQRVKSDPKLVKEVFPEGKANIITRNYPLTPEELKKKIKLKDGGDLYLLAFSGQKEKFLIAAERIK